MGANYSSSNNLSKDGFRHTIDYIATYYIVTMDFESLKKLTDTEYCNQLIILTSDIISKYATTREIQYMVKKQGSDMYEDSELKRQKVTYFSKNMVDRELPEMVKKEMCMSIASFYIRIAHLFSAIILTINPIYKYRDEYGTLKNVNWANKKDIPEGVDVNVEYSNMCNNRINALEPNDKSQKDGGLFQALSLGSSNVTLSPSICHLQFKPNLLIEEPGIKELEALYYDVYDYNEGKYNSMSPSSRQQYEEDVREFYKSFTGKHDTVVPSDIKSFNDIPIQQYNMCNNPDYTEPITVSSSNSIYQKYADNLNEMKRYASINQEKLMDIISKIFVYTVNKKTGKKQIRINPRLNDALLDNLTQQSRNYITQLYINCQQSYDRGVHLYQDIVESVISKTLDNRISNTENEEYEEMKDIKSINDEPSYHIQANNNDFTNSEEKYIPSQIDNQTPVTNKQNAFNPYQPPANEYQPPVNEYQQPDNEYQPPVNEYQPPANEYQPPVNEYQQPVNEYQPPVNEYQPPVNEYQPPVNEYQQPVNEYQPPANEYQQPVNEYQQPVNEYQPPVNEYQPPVNEYQQPVNEYQPPVNEYQQPVNEYQQPVNEYQQPVNEYQPPRVNSELPTIYTTNDKYEKSSNISVSSIPYLNNSKTISDRDVTEHLNKLEFGKK
jgi:hypothetical protein